MPNGSWPPVPEASRSPSQAARVSDDGGGGGSGKDLGIQDQLVAVLLAWFEVNRDDEADDLGAQPAAGAAAPATAPKWTPFETAQTLWTPETTGLKVVLNVTVDAEEVEVFPEPGAGIDSPRSRADASHVVVLDHLFGEEERVALATALNGAPDWEDATGSVEQHAVLCRLRMPSCTACACRPVPPAHVVLCRLRMPSCAACACRYGTVAPPSCLPPADTHRCCHPDPAARRLTGGKSEHAMAKASHQRGA